MALDFGTHEDVVFQRAPLVSVLSQVKFRQILALLGPAGVAGFQAALRSDYPNTLDPDQGMNIEVGAAGIGVNQTAPTWRFQDQSEQWTVGISTDFVSLETVAYTSIDDFLTRFRQILNVLVRTLRPSLSTRIGLRKINAFALPETRGNALNPIFRPEFLGLAAVSNLSSQISSFTSHIEMTDEFNVLAINAGLATLADNKSPVFALDLDYFTQVPHEIQMPATIDILRYFSDGMTDFFHWAVADDYKASLGPSARTGRAVHDTHA